MKIAVVLAALPALASAFAVRKDWATLSQAEKDTFATGLNIMKAQGVYDELVRLHLEAYLTPCPWGEEDPDTLYRNGDQKGPAFLPWHREQLLQFERELQKAVNDDSFGIPYWNFMNDATSLNPKENPMWTPEGVGGDGVATAGGRPVVIDGPFAYWPIKYSQSDEKFLERTLGKIVEHPANAGDMLAAFNQTEYDSEPYSARSKTGFRNWVEGFYSTRGQQGREPGDLMTSMHAQAHGFIGASMLTGTSPNDPAFFLVHSFTDGLWYQWQNMMIQNNPGSTFSDHYQPHANGPIGHNIDDALVSLGGKTARDVLDTTKLPYAYAGLPLY